MVGPCRVRCSPSAAPLLACGSTSASGIAVGHLDGGQFEADRRLTRTGPGHRTGLRRRARRPSPPARNWPHRTRADCTHRSTSPSSIHLESHVATGGPHLRALRHAHVPLASHCGVISCPVHVPASSLHDGDTNVAKCWAGPLGRRAGGHQCKHVAGRGAAHAEAGRPA